jgi:peroxiredoxin
MINRVAVATWLSLVASMALYSQQASAFEELSRGSKSCPRRESNGGSAHGSTQMRGYYEIPSDKLITPLERRSVLNFAVYQSDGALREVSNYKGKVVVVGFWSTICEISQHQLVELMDIQNQVKQGDFNTVVWPVHIEQWTNVKEFLRTYSDRLNGVEVYRAGLGSQGPSVLVGTDIPALPAIFLIDRQGRLAQSWFSFEPKRIFEAVNKLRMEP